VCNLKGINIWDRMRLLLIDMAYRFTGFCSILKLMQIMYYLIINIYSTYRSLQSCYLSK